MKRDNDAQMRAWVQGRGHSSQEWSAWTPIYQGALACSIACPGMLLQRAPRALLKDLMQQQATHSLPKSQTAELLELLKSHVDHVGDTWGLHQGGFSR